MAIVCPFVLQAQDLIVNGGLESMKRCPTGPSLKRLKVDGKVKTAQRDPDLYATCSEAFGVPGNWSGHQEAWEGDAYAGLVLTSDMPNECGMREYIQFPLATPLENGRRYRLSFRVSPSEHSGYVTDRIAAQFSAVDHSGKGVPAALRERADVENTLGRLLNDTSGWTTVTGIHNAKGDERFVIIGNFHTCNSSTRIRMYGDKKDAVQRKAAARLDPVAKRGAWREWMARTAYVLLDGVSLVPDSTGPDRIVELTSELACPSEVPAATGPELVPDPGFDRNLHPTPDSWRNASNGTPDLNNGETGIYLYSDGYTDNREYIRIPLAETLSPCSTYRVSLDARMNASYAFAVDAIGIAVADSFSTRHDRMRLDLPWAWRSPAGALMTNADRSITLCGTFVPGLCAEHLLVGNFGPDSATTVVRVGADNDGPFAYYFLDNVHLSAVGSVPGCIDPCAASVSVAEADDVLAGEWPEFAILHFDSDSELPLEVDGDALDRLASSLVSDTDLSVHITGHTDDSGTAVRNQALGLARAERLRALLVQRGAPPSSIHTSSAGSRRPIADNESAEGRAMNRRVEVELKR
jgi:flagellar motor protein MotB